MRLKTTEHAEQAKVIEWANWQARINPELELLFAVPNSAKRTKYTRNKMLNEGLKSGVPDLMLPVPRMPYHGLFIEMKVKGRKPFDKQVYWLRKLSEQGYLATVCYSGDEAINLLISYLRK